MIGSRQCVVVHPRMKRLWGKELVMIVDHHHQYLRNHELVPQQLYTFVAISHENFLKIGNLDMQEQYFLVEF